MRVLPQGLAAAVYRQAAKFSARVLVRSPVVESVLLHRSAATGEVDFARSDIDLLLVIGEQAAGDGEALASLLRLVNRARFMNPALSHIDVFEPSALTGFAAADTFWASTERRTVLPLAGKPVEIPAGPVHPDHALSRFLLWVEWYFAIAVQQGNRRNLRKTALESWNAYAVADRLISEPGLRRSEMAGQARRFESGLETERLAEPSYAARFVFGLADRLHRSRLKPLRRLSRPLIFEAVTAPLCLRRLFVVVPGPDSPLPPEAFLPGAFPCTPEYLDLFAHPKNPFLHWIFPPLLTDLGIAPPAAKEFLLACRFYGHTRFLFMPGFANPGPSTQAARMALVRHAADWALRNEAPPPVQREKIGALMASGLRTAEAYYRNEYGPLRAETRRLQESLRGLGSAAKV
ncbi:MAG TPA: hypothetical protein VLH09_02200 [Bryobacteraceae bacterium]|nr:hypothetical protein [Bryobacteraceae bacterium]